jgi:hypothetical protein
LKKALIFEPVIQPPD